MERILILTCLVIVTASAIMAEPPLSSAYGAPGLANFNFNNNLNSISNFARNQNSGGYQNFANTVSTSGGIRGTDPALLGASIQGPKVFRHISLFVAPQDSEEQQQVRIIRPQQAADKHYQIIFVKAPSHSSSQQTEVILPEQPEQKTLVYVLVKKPEAGANNVKIRGPAATKPPPPEVYFIKYKDGGRTGAAGGPSGGYTSSPNLGFGGGSFPSVRSPGLSTSYGAP